MTHATIRDWLRSLEGAEPPDQWVMLCFVAGRDVNIDDGEANAALRRAGLLLATGGDPRRQLELRGRAVGSVADDLDTPERRQQLALGLAALEVEAMDLRSAAEALSLLRADPQLAWRCFAAALLADELGSAEG